jgi:hypothetical protein
VCPSHRGQRSGCKAKAALVEDDPVPQYNAAKDSIEAEAL